MTDQRPSATSRLRLIGYAVVLTALAFSQAPGRIVPDTKFDLVAAPWRFLSGAARMWDAQGAFGQIQNQAVGYLWPMGPFFGVGHLLALPEWVIQRLWWALLLNLAFFGVLRLCAELRLGRPWALVAAASAYVVAPRATTIIGATSVELWPTAVAPWVLLAVVRGSRRGSVVGWAALAALGVACAGGVNATAVSAVVPAGVIWLLTRARGPRRWRFLAWWAGLTVLATSWWLVPLSLQGRYSVPFLDYIETAAVTSSVTDLTSTLLGTSNWVAYLGAAGYPAGAMLVTTPFLVLDAAVVVAVGLAGLAGVGRRRHPEARFGWWCLVAGLVLVGIGYSGDLHGWAAATRQDWLDGALAALRNSHKYDVLLRLSLSLGVAWAVDSLLAGPAGRLRDALTRRDATALVRRVLLVATAVAIVGLAFPWAKGEVAPPGGAEAIPAYWPATAHYLAATDDGGVTLAVPAAPFGDYTWGSTHDDVLQPYADSGWAVRNVVPLAQAGNVEMLDEVTALLESGRPSAELAPLLARAGVSRLLVRNDLDRLVTGAPDPAYVHAALDGSPGLTPVASFGPTSGVRPLRHADDGTRVITDGGLSGRYPAVQVYRVDATAAGDAELLPATSTLMGDPGAPGADGGSTVLTADSGGARRDPTAPQRVVLTDGLRRRAESFQAVRDNRSATAGSGPLTTTDEPEQFRRILPDQERWQSSETWEGIAGVTSSSSAASVAATPPLDRGSGPSAAFDRDRRTAWRTGTSSSDGQWLRVAFQRPTAVGRVRVGVPAGAAAVRHLVLSAGSVRLRVAAPYPGSARTYDVGAADAHALTVSAEDPVRAGWWGINELTVAGVHPRRLVALPTPPSGAVVDEIRLARDQGRSACPSVQGTVSCFAFLGTTGDDGDRLDRRTDLSAAGEYDVAGTASLRRGPAYSYRLAQRLGVGLTVSGSAATDLADSPVAMLDGDPGTTWRAGDDPVIRLRLHRPVTVRSITLAVGQAAAVSAPDRVTVVDGHAPRRHRVTARLDSGGRLAVPGWRTDALRIRVESVTPAYDQPSAGGEARELGPGVSELLVDGASPAAGSLDGECGDGPVLDVAGTRWSTAAGGSLADLLRGSSVPLRLCGRPAAAVPAGPADVTADPGRLFRADTLVMSRTGSGATSDTTAATGATTGPGAATTIPVRRDGRDRPLSAEVGASPDARVLALPQNENTGATATLGGTPLSPVRVDGWKQGWLVPAGAAGTVHFGYPPEHVYVVGLTAGLGALLLVVVVALVGRRGRGLAPTVAGRSRMVDAVLVVAAAGVLAGWAGAVAAVAALVVVRRLTAHRELLAQAGVGAALVAALPRVLASVDWPAAQWWGQAWALVAVLLVGSVVLSAEVAPPDPTSAPSDAEAAGSRRARTPRFFSLIARRSSKV